ncbi:protein kinase [Actinoplanes sp. Pm04-4]|uniref:non-specific serine/threonine protein kinase n=1 Tax=Paractinoplanes pyxinae TaxID=2997416 RepID=A0ABT4B628_9ACTN|nr:serine/threonine-protein kinase [Actinoplanes pyxinae]MCY1141931.1 protein kinase [Actinoplanes pyxinae]
MLAAGHLLGNRYRLDERIATGGMGDVWRGTDVVLGRVIAVKVLRSNMMADPEFAARFYGEARMMAAFRHPGVVEVYDYASADESGGDDGMAYLVMAYVEGEPLSTRVKQGPMPVAEVMSIVGQAADALHAAHQAGTVHRDVKPGNLIVKPNGTVVLVDFGVARSAAVTSVTAVNAIVGTALYMAPEQVAKGNVSAATDIYALGAVAYHCIAGHPPFDGDNALQVALRHLEDEPEPLPEHVPLEVRQLIERAMAKQPGDRFQSGEEFAEAAFAAAGPLDWKRMTGTSMVAPLSPAAPTRAVPLPRDLPPKLPPAAPGSLTSTSLGAKRPPRSQTALLVAVIALLVLAGGLAFAIALTNGDDDDKKQVNNPLPGSSAGPASDEAPSSEVSETPSLAPTSHSVPRGNAPGRTRTPSATPSTTPPTTAPTTTPPTTVPTTTPPTTRPTTPPVTTPPVTTPPVTTTPPVDPPVEGANP